MPIIDAALSASWAMSEEGARLLLEIANRETQVTPEALEAYRAKSLERSERATHRNGVAILQIEGPLFKRANLMTEHCGATSYEQVMRDFQTARDSASVRAILLNIHSPGGVVDGCAELAKAVFEARGDKPIIAYAGDQMSSAAYWIGSAADRIVIGPTAQVGCIGVRAALTDTSAREKALGIRTVEFVSSQTPYKRADLNSDEGRARIQARVDALAQVFIQTVAAYRGVSVAHAMEAFGKGDVLVGKSAIDAGLADVFGSFESVLASLSRESDPITLIGSSVAANGLNIREDQMKTDPNATATDKPVTENTAPTPAATAAPINENAVADATQAAIVAERARVNDIMTLALPGYETQRDEAIQSGSSANDFSRLMIAAEKAKRTERADAVAEDTKVNADVKPSTGKDTTTGDDAAVKMILDARAAALGE